jgi:hypothetical protein
VGQLAVGCGVELRDVDGQKISARPLDATAINSLSARDKYKVTLHLFRETGVRCEKMRFPQKALFCPQNPLAYPRNPQAVALTGRALPTYRLIVDGAESQPCKGKADQADGGSQAGAR